MHEKKIMKNTNLKAMYFVHAYYKKKIAVISKSFNRIKSKTYHFIYN